MSQEASTLSTTGTWIPERNTRLCILWGILLLALTLRLTGVFADYPFSYYGDELHFIKRAMSLGTGDLNPHWFHKPALLMYLLLGCYGIYFVVGSLVGLFDSVEQFGAHFLTNMGPFIVIGRCLIVIFGVATVYVVYRIASKAFGGFAHGALAALIAAVCYPMAVGSQSVKADVPSGFLVALSFYWFLKSTEHGRFRPMAIASLLAGAAMGTKYYGAILVPGYVVMELAARFLYRRPWKRVILGAFAVILLFLVGFFVTSPYNFLDPTWGRGIQSGLLTRTGLQDSGPIFDPDTETVYQPGLSSALSAAKHLFERALDSRALGIGFTVLAVLGLIGCSLDRRTRSYAAYVAFPLAGFVLFSSFWSSFHISWRHFNAVLPLVCTLVFPGALFLVQTVRVPRRWAVVTALVLVLIPTGVDLVSTLRYDLVRLLPDTRTAAYRWVVANIDPAALVLLDEYGPILQPSPEAARRQRQRLEGLPESEAFTTHETTRLDLLERYPSPDAMNFDELAHPWWLNREITDAELRASWNDRDMGNPIKLRVPKTVGQYREEGYRYVITNSRAQEGYFESNDSRQAFPSFVRFYEGLRDLQSVYTLEPEDLGGRGPTIWIYELETGPVLAEEQ